MMPRLKAKMFSLSFIGAKNLVSLLFLYVQIPVFTFNLCSKNVLTTEQIFEKFKNFKTALYCIVKGTVFNAGQILK